MAPVKELHFEELKAALENEQVILVDVRNHAELAEHGKIPKSFCIPLPELTEAFSLGEVDFMSKYGFPKPPPTVGSSLVISCRSGRRVGVALEQLDTLGYSGLGAYRGSFLDWEKNNGAIEK